MALLAIYLVFGIWYPSPLAEATGVTDIFLILLGVDITLGPILTFLVAKQGKKTLFFDFLFIVVLQVAAFGYGMWVVAEGRPAWLVFNIDRVDLVRVDEIDTRKLQEADPMYARPSWFGPQWAGSKAPEDLELHNELVLDAMISRLGIQYRPNFFVPFHALAEEIRRTAKTLDELERYNTVKDVEVIRMMWPSADAWVPLMARNKAMVVLINRESTQPVAIVDLNPWD